MDVAGGQPILSPGPRLRVQHGSHQVMTRRLYWLNVLEEGLHCLAEAARNGAGDKMASVRRLGEKPVEWLLGKLRCQPGKIACGEITEQAYPAKPSVAGEDAAAATTTPAAGS